MAIDHYHGKSENVHTNVLKLTPSPAENSIQLFVSGVFTVDGAKSKLVCFMCKNKLNKFVL